MNERDGREIKMVGRRKESEMKRLAESTRLSIPERVRSQEILRKEARWSEESEREQEGEEMRVRGEDERGIRNRHIL